jgi:RNA polymerase sigma factor (sigma-70 family)
MAAATGECETRRAIEFAWREEAARIVAGLTRVVDDIGLAEELAQDAFVDALERWPEIGIPPRPGAWLMAAAKYRAIDRLRRRARLVKKQEELGRLLQMQEQLEASDWGESADDDIDDDLLRLIFTACHPVIPPDSRVAMTLRVVGGLTTGEIARAFLASEATVAQRIVRAKRGIAAAGVPFEVPSSAERPARLASVLEVIYLIFNEGYSATSGEEWTRPTLCQEALRLATLLSRLLPTESDVWGLMALMEFQASRLRARRGPDGEAILLLDQDRTRWDRPAIARGFQALDRVGETPGTYGIQAAIAACHARARTPGETDWRTMSSLYARLAEVAPSPVVELNRAVAVAMDDGLVAALELVDNLCEMPELREYPLLPSVRGQLLARLGRFQEGEAEIKRAITLTRNARERTVLEARAAACARHEQPPGPF